MRLLRLPTVTSTQLTSISRNLLQAAGASEEEAEIVTKSLVNANLAGVDSHGVVPNLVVYVEGVRSGSIRPGAKIENMMQA